MEGLVEQLVVPPVGAVIRYSTESYNSQYNSGVFRGTVTAFSDDDEGGRWVVTVTSCAVRRGRYTGKLPRTDVFRSRAALITGGAAGGTATTARLLLQFVPPPDIEKWVVGGGTGSLFRDESESGVTFEWLTESEHWVGLGAVAPPTQLSVVSGSAGAG